jgi:hypothetical protein
LDIHQVAASINSGQAEPALASEAKDGVGQVRLFERGNLVGGQFHVHGYESIVVSPAYLSAPNAASVAKPLPQQRFLAAARFGPDPCWRGVDSNLQFRARYSAAELGPIDRRRLEEPSFTAE